jgi:hypothetical protein
MSVPVLTTQSTVLCTHGGTVTLTTSNTQALIDRSPALLETDVHPVVGCPFTLPSATPSPCVTVRWSAGATQAKVNGVPVLLQSSVGVCYSAAQAPQGTATIAQVQQRAKAT